MSAQLVKYSGAGNTFLIGEALPPHAKVSDLCATCHVDGVILFKKNSSGYSQMRIFNADGSEAEMCGNGLRCLIDHLHKVADPGLPFYVVETKAGTHRGWPEGCEIATLFPTPHSYAPNIIIEFENRKIAGDFVNSGVPHLVVFEQEEEVEKVGRTLRFHPRFAPEGTNVDFIQILSPSTLSIRTYERGVERETLACGTGAVASAFAAMQKFSLKGPFQISVRSSEVLSVNFSEEGTTLQGKVERMDSFSLLGINEKSPILAAYDH